MAPPLYLAELVAYDPATASVTTLRYASGQGFVTTAAETPASTWYDARIKQPVNIPRHLFGSGKLSGRSRVSYGDLVLWNPDGALDAVLGYGLAGRAVTILRGEAGAAYPSGFTTIFAGTMEQAEVVGDTLLVKMRDKQADLDVPLQPVKYAGTNALPDGLEGVANDLQGKPKPVCLGQVQNVPVPCVNTARLIYQVADRSVTVDAAYDSGVPLMAGFPLTSRTSGFGTSNVIAVAYGAGVYVAVGNDGKLASSEDGTTWTLRTSGFGTSYISAVAYGDGQFVAVGENGKVSTSPDGFTWTAQTSGTGNWIKGIARGNGLWVLGASSGIIRTSPDAVTWTARTSGISDAIYGLAFGNGRFVAVGDNAACTVSSDGLTWTPVDTGSDATFLYDVAYAGGLFLAAGNAGTVVTSPDGTVWADRDVGFSTANIYGTYAGTTLDGQSSVYVVVGAGGRIATSPDGVTWTTETSGVAASIALWGITFGDGRYVAAGSDGMLYSSGIGSAYASLSQLMDDDETPLAGSVRAYSGTEGTYIRLGASPAGQITVDASEGATAAARTAGQLFVKVLQRAGKVTDDWTAADITTLDTAASAVCGYWTAEETTCAEALDLITGSVWAWWGPGRDGTYRVQQLTAPSGTAALELTANDLLRPLSRLAVADETKGLPSWRSIVRYGRNYAVQVGGGAAGAGGTSTTGPGGDGAVTDPVTAQYSTVPRSLSERFAETRNALDYSGADWQAKVSAALATLPAVGGVIDARGLTGTQTAASRLDITGDNVTLLLGPMTLECATHWIKVTGANATILGAGRGQTAVTATTTWDGTNLFGIEVEDANGFTLRGVGLAVHRTGTALYSATNAMAVYIHGTSRGWVVEDNDLEASGTEPYSEQRYLGVFAWTATASPPITCGDGLIRGNIVRDTDGRCIEVALCDNVTIADNVITTGGSAATIVCVGVRVIGGENVSVTGNAVDITGGATLGNADCLQVNGDNVSTNIVLIGNACRTNANGGTGIKIGGNASYVTCVGNDVYYDGASTALYGILVTSNPGAPEAPPTHILVSGNRVKGFGSQLGIDREDAGDTYPDTVSFIGNQLGTRFDGSATLGVFYNGNSVDITANNILIHGNHIASTSLTTMPERFQGVLDAPAVAFGVTTCATAGEVRLPNTGSLRWRNNAASADVTGLSKTTADHVQVGGTNCNEVQLLYTGTTTARIRSAALSPGSSGGSSLGESALQWNNLYLSGDIQAAAGGFRQTIDNWTQDNVAASQTNVELTRATGRFRAVRAGSVTGVIATMTEARTAGTLTVTVYKNTGLAGAAGSTIGLTAVIDGTNTSRSATTQAKDTDTFAAGDEIYAVVTTDGSWAPTTSDLRVALEIED